MPTIQGCPQMFFGLLIVDVLIKHPTRNLIILHAAITRIVRDAVQYGCFQSMLGVYTPLPLRNEPRSNIQQSDCLRVDEILEIFAEPTAGARLRPRRPLGPRGPHRQWMCSDWAASSAASPLDIPPGPFAPT